MPLTLMFTVRTSPETLDPAIVIPLPLCVTGPNFATLPSSSNAQNVSPEL